MIRFLVVKTKKGFAYIRPDAVLAVNSSDPAECMILLTDGVTIAAAEPAEDVVARLEAEARDKDAHAIRETRNGHEPR